jgi:hypothetical protein
VLNHDFHRAGSTIASIAPSISTVETLAPFKATITPVPTISPVT